VEERAGERRLFFGGGFTGKVAEFDSTDLAEGRERGLCKGLIETLRSTSCRPRLV
jgi:hypothetical protein